MSSYSAAPDIVRRRLTGKRHRPLEALVSLALLTSLLVCLALLAVLLTDVVTEGWPVLSTRLGEFLVNPLSADPSRAGLGQGIFGSIVLIVIVALLSFPLGVGAAIYLEEYASDTRLNRLLVSNVRNLAGVPSIVYGLLGLTVFVKSMSGITNGRTLVAGGLTLSILVLPIIVITASEALRAVPRELREASFGVGATEWETVRHHVLPVAFPGILTGSVLAVARAFGESAPLLLAGAVLSNFFTPPGATSLASLITEQSYTGLPIVIFNWARQPQQEFIALTAAGIVVLLVILLLVNTAAIVTRDRFERRRIS
ncbi:MAG TPA: phosphate ABC transporter permease PstA [Acidimicrobiia bacterium]|nr:phosphate ABC transporter permease PstA [Acidimicrobiia bacterium]